MVAKPKKGKKKITKKITRRKNKYIPHLAEFFFQPEPDWSIIQAHNMYYSKENKLHEKLHYRDCISGMKNMPLASVDLIIADPPFGIDFSGKESIYNRKNTNVIDNYQEIESDYFQFTLDWIGKLPHIMKETASAYIISGYTNLKDVLIAIDEAKLTVKNHIIWKYQFGVFTKTKFVSSHYHILFIVKNPKKYFYHRIEHYTPDVWTDIPRVYAPGQKKNGTKLPEKLVQRCIDFSSKPGDLVFDPFMGNGTTASVAKANYRHYCGFEKNLKMKKVIQSNIDAVNIGQDYEKYNERLKTPEELKDIDKDYQKAYREYLKLNKVKV